MEFEASLPSHGQALELVEQRERLLEDVAELVPAIDVRGAVAGDHRRDAAASHCTAHGLRVVCLVAQAGFGSPPRTARMSATAGMSSARWRVWVMSLVLAAVMMTCSAVPLSWQIRWCLLPAFRRAAGGGPVAEPPRLLCRVKPLE